MLNALLLVPLMTVMYRLSRDPDVMGGYAVGGSGLRYTATIGFVTLCVGALLVLSLVPATGP